MTTLFAANYANQNARTQGEMKVVFETLRSVLAETLGGSGEVTLALSSDTLTPANNSCQIIVDSQSAGAADDLRTIAATNMRDGQLLLLRCSATNEPISVINNVGGAGQIATADGATFILKDPKQFLITKYNASLGSGTHEEVFRSYANQKADFRTYLGLGTAAVLNSGTTSGTLPLFENVWEKVTTYNKNLVVCSHGTTDGQVLTARALVAADLPTVPLTKGGINTTNTTGAAKAVLIGNASSGFKELIGASAGQSIRVNAGNSDIEFYTPGNSTAFESSNQTITIAGNHDITHGLATRPTNLWAALVCTDMGGEHGYLQNDIVITADGLNGGICGHSLWTDNATHIRARCNSNNITVIHKTTGALNNAITTTKWRIRFYAI